jgi:hypothetical protein
VFIHPSAVVFDDIGKIITKKTIDNLPHGYTLLFRDFSTNQFLLSSCSLRSKMLPAVHHIGIPVLVPQYLFALRTN